MEIKENVDIKNYTTFKIGGIFRYFTLIDDKKELSEAYKFAEEHKVKVFILGGGSNLIFPDGILDVLILKINIFGFEIIPVRNAAGMATVGEDDNSYYTDIKIGAGENWDEVVARTVDIGLSGLETLSAIPGTVGATPIQNVGAYGSEVKDFIVEVEVFDIKEKKIIILSNKDCKFSYRDSIFKNEGKGNYVVTAVTFRLSKSSPEIPNYRDVKKYFIENQINNPHLKEIREAIIFIRNQKLPNPEELPNAGSFFKNPIIEKNIVNKIKEEYQDVPVFPISDNKVKISAGWLIDNAGLKGVSFGKISVYKKNALVLINTDNATKEDLILAKDQIVKIVKEKFDITLEQEPEMI